MGKKVKFPRVEPKYLKGTKGRFKNLHDFLNGKNCEVVGETQDENEIPILQVRTTECIGAQPAGVEYDIHFYEFEPEVKNG